MAPAGYAFATLAHLSHDDVVDEDETSPTCIVKRQLGNTRDIDAPWLTGEITLFLDRQRAHHLFPTVDHRRFSREFILWTRDMA
jgi:fatty acid desaturase